jgi:hypothetical protein
MKAPASDRVLTEGIAVFGQNGAELGIVTDVSDPSTFVLNNHGSRLTLDRTCIAIIALDFVLVRATGAQLRDTPPRAR